MFLRLNVHVGKSAVELVLIDVSTVCLINTIPGFCCQPETLKSGDHYLDGEAAHRCRGYWSHWEGSGGRRSKAHMGPWGGAGGGNHHQTCNIPDSPPLKCTFIAQIVHLKKSTRPSMKWRIKPTDLNVARWSWQLETSGQQ